MIYLSTGARVNFRWMGDDGRRCVYEKQVEWISSLVFKCTYYNFKFNFCSSKCVFAGIFVPSIPEIRFSLHDACGNEKNVFCEWVFSICWHSTVLKMKNSCKCRVWMRKKFARDQREFDDLLVLIKHEFLWNYLLENKWKKMIYACEVNKSYFYDCEYEWLVFWEFLTNSWFLVIVSICSLHHHWIKQSEEILGKHHIQ